MNFLLLLTFIPLVFTYDGFLSLSLNKFQDPVEELIKNFTDLFDAQQKTVGDETGSFQVELSNARTYYFIDLKVGNPQQSIRTMIDTGSADLWFIGKDNLQCASNGGTVDCQLYGTFDESKSSTWQTNNTAFEIGYLDGSEATGIMGKDGIEFAENFALDNAEFAVVKNTTENIGVFGIGYSKLESTNATYSNIPKLLKDQGVISKVAYSIYLNSKNSTQGYILFGGIDYAKFDGELTDYDIVPFSGQYLYSQIALSHISFSCNNYTGSNNGPRVGAVAYNGTGSFNGAVDIKNQPALLDTGTTYTYLLQKQVESLVKNFGNSSYNQLFGMYNVPCYIGNPGNYFTFNFGQQGYQVDASEFVINNPVGGCLFTILNSVDGSLILGDNFLRSVYALFDLEDNKISLAQANYNDNHQVVPIY
ncbi:unnamed protein product [Candida verbasci]|uniref:candidapepsin n=1 Tax=Candida verbasci TaxID=1227364 RepID=A0A9W4TUI7_9ASCO|nr:unnamed protein product [Candida verbasci]